MYVQERAPYTQKSLMKLGKREEIKHPTFPVAARLRKIDNFNYGKNQFSAAPLQKESTTEAGKLAKDTLLYVGVSSNVLIPSTSYANGTWYGPRVTGAEYANNGGSLWTCKVKKDLQLLNMDTTKAVAKVINYIKSKNNSAIPQALQSQIDAYNFAYALPKTLIEKIGDCYNYIVNDCLYMATKPTQAPNDLLSLEELQLVYDGEGGYESVFRNLVQGKCDHNSGNAVKLSDATFLASPQNYVMMRKDATDLDLGFVGALIGALGEGKIDGVYVPNTMQFPSTQNTKTELMLWKAQNVLHDPVAAKVSDADTVITSGDLSGFV